MPATATQLPFVRGEASRTGTKLFRKQVLPLGKVTHPVHGELSFTADRLGRLRDGFLAGAMDCVPFVIVDDANKHTDDPSRARGEVKGIELAADGLYATIETSDAGTELLRNTPNLPVSVRLKTLADGSEVLAHVAGTHDPVARGLKPWEAIDASSGIEVMDFSDRGTFTLPGVTTTVTAPPTDPTSAPEAFTPEEVGKVRAFFARLTGTGTEPPVEPPAPTAPVVTATTPPPATPPATPVVAPTATPALALSDADRTSLDMANAGVLDLAARLGVSEMKGNLEQYIRDGVPPALVNAARTSLLGDGTKDLSATQKTVVVDFANSKGNPASDALFAALDAAKGTVDFSEKGTTVVVDMSSDEQKAAQKRCDDAAKGYA